jgi:hypothetical protein
MGTNSERVGFNLWVLEKNDPSVKVAFEIRILHLSLSFTLVQCVWKAMDITSEASSKFSRSMIFIKQHLQTTLILYHHILLQPQALISYHNK